MKARIREIFCSIQGEGPLLGVRQVFIRFDACNIACDYCDTKPTFKGCRVEKNPGARDFYYLESPLSLEQVKTVAESFGRVHSYSLTGGEPLLNAEFIKELKLGPLYLETNMTLPEKADIIKNKVKFVAGDFKLSFALKKEDYQEIRERTIKSFKILRNSRERYTFAKIVFSREADKEEIYENLEAIKDYISLAVLQPVTPLSKALPQKELLKLQEELSELVEVRIIPQTHKFLNLL